MINPYQLVKAEIIDIKEETPNIKTFVLKPEQELVFRTGQFMEVAIPGFGEAPFTPSSNPNDTRQLEFTIMSVGRLTKTLYAMRPGQKVALRGPYGAGYPLDKFRNKEILIVGGGVGLAPLRSLLYALFNEIDMYKKIDIRYGARTSQDIVYKDQINGWAKDGKSFVTLTVDAGDKSWNGNVGLVTTILNDLKIDLGNSVAIVCGPPIMMKFVTFKLLEVGFKPEGLFLSVEKNMSCGIGKCGHCRIGEFYACKDGPVFSYDKIKEIPNIWD